MLVDIDRVVPAEFDFRDRFEDLVSSYLYPLSHCTWEDAVEILPPLDVNEVMGYYVLWDGHHRLEVLKRMGATYINVKEFDHGD